MISKISRGDDAGGLMRYLGGQSKDDGRHLNFHEDQRVITGSLGLTGPMDPELIRQCITDLEAPGLAHPDVRVMHRTGAEKKAGERHAHRPIWHCSLSLSASEGVKSDEQWKAIADDFMAKMGFDDPCQAPARWVGIRHGLSEAGNDHVHIAASLIREDGRPVRVFRDFARSQDVCNELEHRHGLEVLASRETGTGRTVSLSAAELDRARKSGEQPDRVRLESSVRGAAVSSRTEGEFVRRLRRDGLTVRPRVSDGTVTGYSVALSQDGVGYAGGTLARDLTLPKLRAGWKPDDARSVWGGDPTPGREAGVLRIDRAVYRKAGAELKSLERQLVAGGMSLAQIAEASHAVAGALSAAATRPEYARGEVPKAAREAGRMASTKNRPEFGTSRLALSAGLILMQAKDPNGDQAKAIMVAQLLATFDAVRNAHRSAVGAQQKGRTMAEPDGIEEFVEGMSTMGVTVAARAVEARAGRERSESLPADLPEVKVEADRPQPSELDRRNRRRDHNGDLAPKEWDGYRRAGEPVGEYVRDPAVIASERETVEEIRAGRTGRDAYSYSSEPVAETGRAVQRAHTRPPGEWKTGDQPATEKQRAVLANRGVGVEDLKSMSKSAASEMIGRQKVGNVTAINPATELAKPKAPEMSRGMRH